MFSQMGEENKGGREMKFRKKDTKHKTHYFVVDSSNTFSVCSVCGLEKKRKIIIWNTKEEEK